MAMQYTVTNEQIAEALEAFGLPVEYGGISADTLNGYNFFYYAEDEMTPGEGRIWTQTVNIFYASLNKESLLEGEIVAALKAIKLSVRRVTYNRLPIENTNDFVDVVTFVTVRKVKLGC